MADLNLEIRPDFAANPYRTIREAIMDTFSGEVAQAVECLNTAWDDNHNSRVEAWNLQQEAEQREAQHLQQEQRDLEEQERQQAEEESERERREAKKKKPKINNFNENRAPPIVIVPRPSQYVIQKISAFNFVELWYFSPEGCSEAAKNHHSQADDSFGLTSSNNILTLHPVVSVRASRLACANHNLSFSEFLRAKNSFLHHIKQVSWPNKHINTLAEFFWNLENHPIRTNENSDTIALLYAVRIHRQWHDDLKSNSGTTFNIAIISDALLTSIAFELNMNCQAKTSRKVHSPFFIPTTVPCSPLSFPLLPHLPLPTYHFLSLPPARCRSHPLLHRRHAPTRTPLPSLPLPGGRGVPRVPELPLPLVPFAPAQRLPLRPTHGQMSQLPLCVSLPLSVSSAPAVPPTGHVYPTLPKAPPQVNQQRPDPHQVSMSDLPQPSPSPHP